MKEIRDLCNEGQPAHLSMTSSSAAATSGLGELHLHAPNASPGFISMAYETRLALIEHLKACSKIASSRTGTAVELFRREDLGLCGELGLCFDISEIGFGRNEGRKEERKKGRKDGWMDQCAHAYVYSRVGMCERVRVQNTRIK